LGEDVDKVGRATQLNLVEGNSSGQILEGKELIGRRGNYIKQKGRGESIQRSSEGWKLIARRADHIEQTSLMTALE